MAAKEKLAGSHCEKPVPRLRQGGVSSNSEGSKKEAVNQQFKQLHSSMGTAGSGATAGTTPLVPSTALHVDEIRSLATVGQEARWTSKQGELLEKFDQKKKRKRELALEDVCPPGSAPKRRQKLEEKERDRNKLQAEHGITICSTSGNERASLFLNAVDARLQVHAPACPILRKRFRHLGILPLSLHTGISGIEEMLRQPRCKKWLWWAHDGVPAALRANVQDVEENTTAEKLAIPAVAARLFGGHLIDDEWLCACERRRAKQQDTLLIQPSVLLAAAILNPIEWWVHPNLKARQGFFYDLMHLTLPSKNGEMSLWCPRRRRLRLGGGEPPRHQSKCNCCCRVEPPPIRNKMQRLLPRGGRPLRASKNHTVAAGGIDPLPRSQLLPH